MADVITTVIDLGTPINVTVEANGAEWVAEENRRDNEKLRVQAEAVRTENENIRKQAENQRIQNENLRKSTVETIEREYAPRLNAVESGSPKGTYANLQALNIAYPKGNTYTYITLDNGNWNYWDSSTSTWKAGGLYQSVKGEAYNISVNDADNNFDADNVEDALKEVAIKNQASNALIGKASGELLNIYTAPAKARKLGFLGSTLATPADPSKPISVDNKATLESVGEGNLFDSSGFKSTYSSYGIVLTKSDNNIITLNGTSTSIIDIYIAMNEDITSYYQDVLKMYNKIKTIQGNITLSNNLGLINYLYEKGKYVTDTAKASDVTVAFVRIPAGRTFDNTELKIQLNYGTTSQSYVPYGCTKVHVCGKNLINFADRYVSDESSASTITRVYGNTEYTISYNLKRNDAITPNQKSYQGWYKILDIRGNIISQNRITYANYDTIGNSIVNVTRTLTMPSNACYLVVIFSAYYSNTVMNTWYISSAQLELGSTPTPREPYIGQEYTLPLKDTQGNFIPLRGLTTAKNRVFKDVDGLWKVRCNAGKALFDGSPDENWIKTGNNVDRYYINFPNKGTAPLCSHFDSSIGEETVGGIAYNNAAIGFAFAPKNTTTITDWKSMLQAKPMVLLYPLATPTTTTLHADAQEVLTQIEKLKEGQTVIYGTDKVAPSFDVEYAKDINKAFGDLTDEITKLKLAIISLGGNV